MPRVAVVVAVHERWRCCERMMEEEQEEEENGKGGKTLWGVVSLYRSGSHGKRCAVLLFMSI